MPFELTTRGYVLFARVSGVFTTTDLERLADEVEVIEAADPAALDRVTDLTAVERFEVGFRQIYNFACRRRGQRFSRVVKSAIVARDPMQRDVAAAYEALNENPQIRVRIVRSLAEAKAWIAEPVAELVE